MTSPPSPPELIVLPAHCGLDAAVSLHPRLVEAAAHAPIRIDGSQVESVGQAMLQVLLAAKRSKFGCEITAASTALTERLGGLVLKELTE